MLSSNKEIVPIIKNICLIILGTLTLSFGTAVFIIPFNLVVGGVSSLAIILDKLITADFITVNLLVTVITWTLFFIGLLCLGKNFAFKTLISSIVYPIGISAFSKLVDPIVLNGLFYIQGTQYSDIAILIAALFGGVLVGAGCAVTFVGGGSTGGMDILSFIICRFVKKLRSSVVIFMLDSATIILGMLVLKDLVITLLGIISAFVSALMVDKIFVGGSKAIIAQVISNDYEEINREIISRLERTTTLVNVKGGYSGTKREMLIVSLTMNQYAELMSIINSIDKNAFVTVHRAYEINGEGWTR